MGIVRHTDKVRRTVVWYGAEPLGQRGVEFRGEIGHQVDSSRSNVVRPGSVLKWNAHQSSYAYGGVRSTDGPTRVRSRKCRMRYKLSKQLKNDVVDGLLRG
jgi:hypothetical protein